MINTRNEDGQQIGEQLGLFLEIEGQGTVISGGRIKIDRPKKRPYSVLHLNIGDLGDDLLELVVLPSIRRSLHHSKRGIIEFIVFDVEEDQLRPQMCRLGCLDDLGNIDSGDEELEMVHNCTEGQTLSMN